MQSINDFEKDSSVFVVQEAEIFTGIVSYYRDTSEKGYLVTVRNFTNESGIEEKGSTVCFLREVFNTEEEACEEAIKQCDGIMKELENKKVEVFQELIKGRNRQKRIGKKLLEIRNRIKKELPNLNI
jgi:hypothetical protein